MRRTNTEIDTDTDRDTDTITDTDTDIDTDTDTDTNKYVKYVRPGLCSDKYMMCHYLMFLYVMPTASGGLWEKRKFVDICSWSDRSPK